MPIKQTTAQSQVDAYIDRRMQMLIEALVYRLSVVGEKVINHARSLPSPSAASFPQGVRPHQPNYIDWTANLRSSVGYVIAVDGHIVRESDFRTVKSGKDGSQKGKSYAESLVKNYPKGIVLIVVAGMNYATYVSAKGYDVIDSAELMAQKLVPQIIEKLGLKKK